MRVLRLALWWMLWAPLGLGQDGPTTPQGPSNDPLLRLRITLAELRQQPERGGLYQVDELLALVGALEREALDARTPPARQRDLVLGLLDLAGLRLTPESLSLGRRALDAPRSNRFRRLGLDALRRLIEADRDERVLSVLCEDVLVLLDRHPLERRLAALALVEELRPAGIELGLLTLAQVRRDPLRPAALGLIASWPGDATDTFLVRQLARPRDPNAPHPFTLLLKRVREHGEPLSASAARELVERLGVMLLSSDWRTTARAIELARGLELEVRVPLLIESLRVWKRRADRGKGSKRVSADLLYELRDLSRRSFGDDPDRWSLWWRRIRTGEAPFVEKKGDPPPFATQAQFFGLRPLSDRITFVIDRSGSMDTEWGTTGHTRYEEAVEQLVQFLQASGEDVWFNVILFSHDTLRSSIGLQQATADHVEKARRALLSEPVGGGTHLAPAIRQALHVVDGRLDLEALEADTVVVLCDGQTEEGPGWVRPFLFRYNGEAQVKFHCVLLSSRGDGTLERLADETGGDFLHVGG